jgi:hypothetical protein
MATLSTPSIQSFDGGTLVLSSSFFIVLKCPTIDGHENFIEERLCLVGGCTFACNLTTLTNFAFVWLGKMRDDFYIAIHIGGANTNYLKKKIHTTISCSKRSTIREVSEL